MSFNSLLTAAMRHFRTGRAHRIKALFPNIAEMDVLDLGGSLHFWDVVGEIIRPKSVKILNIAHDGQSLGPSTEGGGRVVLYDGRHIPFDDKSVDLLICNSVIEHVPLDEREGLAREIERVAKHWIIQTPAYEFPVEPHFVAPVLHWLPRKLARSLASITPGAKLGGWKKSPQVYFDEIHLLTRREVVRLFPGSTVQAERLFGWPKAYLAHS
jgi:hypothetical protein